MVIDELQNAELYFGMHEGLAAGLKFLKRTDLAGLAPGRHDIDGDRLFALVMEYDTKPREKAFWEAHRKYYDIQYVLSGEERMGFAPLSHLAAEPYDEAKDFVPAEGDGDFLLVREGSFAIFGPHDAHMPSLHPGARPHPVRKVVVKVAV